MDLDELMEELHKLEGTHVGVSSGAHAIDVTGTLRVAQAEKRALPTGTFILTDELIFSQPAEPTDATGSRSSSSMESVSIAIFQEGPPYEPQVIDLG